MKDFPHLYRASAAGAADGEVALASPALPPLASDSPPEFGGEGGRWSPETLLCAAVADCFILTFRAVAKASKLPFSALSCEVDGTLDRVERVMRFTAFAIRARLTVPEGTDAERARSLLQKAERNCLVSRSLTGTISFEADVVVA